MHAGICLPVRAVRPGAWRTPYFMNGWVWHWRLATRLSSLRSSTGAGVRNITAARERHRRKGRGGEERDADSGISPLPQRGQTSGEDICFMGRSERRALPRSN
ncbi:hypothetical protein Q5P01_014610 [Channa striata]|uniref:Uncharacterized protein n=1 Tax=Channa striata TaxID=64152 RepID=A0AA88SL63_CHASR|nr:hypothetical protein Q5P01_014610 [Channa striata]